MSVGVLNSFNYSHIAANATNTLKTVTGTLHSVVINTPGSTETITVYDNTAGSGTVIAVITPTAAGTILYDIGFNTGLTIVTAGTTAGDYTVCWL